MDAPHAGSARLLIRRRIKETPAAAYDRCLGYVRDCSIESWRSFKVAFPRKSMDGVQNGRLHDLAEHFLAPVHFVKDGFAFLDAQKKLGRTLHTLQDAFSPSHVLREPRGGAITDIYTWDDANKHARPEDGWPGHSAYDHPTYDALTMTNADRAREAIADVIECVLGSAQESEVVFRRLLDAALAQWVAKTF